MIWPYQFFNTKWQLLLQTKWFQKNTKTSGREKLLLPMAYFIVFGVCLFNNCVSLMDERIRRSIAEENHESEENNCKHNSWWCLHPFSKETFVTCLLFVLLYFFFWLLCCLFFFYILILIIPLVSLNSSDSVMQHFVFIVSQLESVN